jgi:hypothetical protein
MQTSARMIGDRPTGISPIGRCIFHKLVTDYHPAQIAAHLAIPGIGRAAVPAAMA